MSLNFTDIIYLGKAVPGSGGGGGGAVSSVNGQTGDVVITGNDVLPDQTGQSGKFLTTDGTDASWSDKPLVNTSESVSNSFTTQGATQISRQGDSTAVGVGANANNSGIPVGGHNTAFGANAKATSAHCSAFGSSARALKMMSNAFGKFSYADGNGALALGTNAMVTANNAIQINASLTNQTNADANTMKVANANGNFEMMSADGTIPEARLADTTNAQQGDVLTLDSTGNAVWQAGGSGGGLPSQTGNAGKFLTTDGTDASWSDKPLVNTATGTNSLTIFGTPTTAVRALNIGYNCSATANAPNATAVGYNSVVDGNGALAIGTDAKATGEGSVAINGKANMPNSAARAVVIGAKVSGDKSVVIMTGYTNYYTNITASYATVLGYIANPNTIESNSFYVGVGLGANQTVKLLGSDGTIPAARHAALPAADGTYTLQLVIADGVPTLSWVAV